MGRTSIDATEMPDLDNTVGEMPKPLRGSRRGRTASVEQLIDVINDGQVHRITNADVANKATWSRRLRYAARLAEKDVEIVFVPEENPDEREPGIYFRGWDKGAAPKRGMRR